MPKQSINGARPTNIFKKKSNITAPGGIGNKKFEDGSPSNASLKINVAQKKKQDDARRLKLWS